MTPTAFHSILLHCRKVSGGYARVLIGTYSTSEMYFLVGELLSINNSLNFLLVSLKEDTTCQANVVMALEKQ